VDKIKLMLLKLPNFDLIKAFESVKRLSPQGLSVVVIEDFSQMLRNYGLATLDYDLNNLFARFDKKKDGLLSFEDFVCEILPISLCDRIKSADTLPHKKWGQDQVKRVLKEI
jgi:hypothetical protein